MPTVTSPAKVSTVTSAAARERQHRVSADELRDLLGDDDFVRMVNARKGLEAACEQVDEMAKGVKDFAILGTKELPSAVSALTASTALDAEEDAARWISRAFTADITNLVRSGPDLKAAGGGEAVLAFAGSVMMLRSALAEVDAAKKAMGDGGVPGTFRP